MYAQIAAFDAKPGLSGLSRHQNGQRYTITIPNRPIADRVPSGDTRPDPRMAVQAMRDIRRIQGVPDRTVAEWIAEGRR